MQAEQFFFQIVVSVCGVLNRHKVRHLVIGGAAVGIHGYYRPTSDREGNPSEKPDVDIWFDPLWLNYQRLLDAFDDFGFDTSRFREEAHPFPKSSFFRFKPEGYTLDFLPRVMDGLHFHTCSERKAVSSIDGTEIAVIGLEDLITLKKKAGRMKDWEDIRILEGLKNQS